MLWHCPGSRTVPVRGHLAVPEPRGTEPTLLCLAQHMEMVASCPGQPWGCLASRDTFGDAEIPTSPSLGTSFLWLTHTLSAKAPCSASRAWVWLGWSSPKHRCSKCSCPNSHLINNKRKLTRISCTSCDTVPPPLDSLSPRGSAGDPLWHPSIPHRTLEQGRTCPGGSTLGNVHTQGCQVPFTRLRAVHGPTGVPQAEAAARGGL